MKITIDPMPALRPAKVETVNKRFNTEASNNMHLDHAYSQKRRWATNNDQRLSNEAQLRGLSVEQLSTLILSKPDIVAEREDRRQKTLARIAAAKTPEELDAI